MEAYEWQHRAHTRCVRARLQPRHVARVLDVVEAAQYPKHVGAGLRGARQRLEHGLVVDKVMRQLPFGIDEGAAAFQDETDLERALIWVKLVEGGRRQQPARASSCSRSAEARRWRCSCRGRSSCTCTPYQQNFG